MKRIYGRLGKLSKHEWHKLLNSNEGLFRPLPNAFKVVGPKLTDDFGVTGDMGSWESSIFNMNAPPEQQDFMIELVSSGKDQWMEYMLHILQATKIWKEDIADLEHLELELENADENERIEKTLINKSAQIAKKKKGINRLRELHPELFNESMESIEITKNKISIAKQRIHAAKLKVEQDLERLHREYPFAFERA